MSSTITSSIRTINPTTGKVEKEFEETTPEQLEQIIADADNAFQTWKNTSFAERARVLKRAAALVSERQDELARICTIDMGKVWAESVGELQMVTSILNYYADNAEKFLADQPVESPDGKKAFVSYEPIGILLSVQPWNFPYYQIVRAAAPNIMAGNTYILKHASNVPQCALAMEKIFHDAGAPKGVYTNIFLPGSKIESLLADPRIKAATLTGSGPAGAAIASAAGANLKKTTLELGGSDPYVVLDDADIDKAVQGAVVGRFSNTGQICIASKRVIVLESIAEEFLNKLKPAVAALKVGDPLDPATNMGPLSSEKALEQVLEQVQDAVAQGAKVIYGGHRIDREGFFMEPTILTDIQPENPAYSEEIFGPVLLFFVVKDEKEAIALANDTVYGLAGTVFGKNIDRAVKVARQITSGTIVINKPATIAIGVELPFGGTKESGYGRDHYIDGIREFVNAKLIKVDDF